MDHITPEDFIVMKMQVTEMYTALIGNNISKDGGLVGQIKNIDHRQDRLDERMGKMEKTIIKMAVYIKLFWASIGSTATAVFSLIIKK
jgi:hypothetical protein